MSTYNLESLFNPASVAVIGASEKQGSIGSALMKNMIHAGYSGSLIPVNPKYQRVHGSPAYSSVEEVQAGVDLAVVATPMATVPSVIDQCVQAGVKGAIIISAGGKEAGPEGRELEQQVLDKAKRGGMRVLGPNCLGIICPGNSLNASFAAHMPNPGNMAFISQSGAICTSMLDLAMQENMGFRYFISIGSMLDVDFGDLIDYVGSDPKVESILLYIESLSNFRKFMSAARGTSRLKPIVVIKSGKSSAGAQAASSHTGAMAGDDIVYDTAFKRAGAVRIGTIGEFFSCAELLSKQSRPRGPRMTVVTNSGGPGVMAVDALSELGLEAAPLNEKTCEKLDEILPSPWSRGNPIDILGDATPQRYVQTVNALDPRETDGLLIILNPQAMTDPGQVAQELTRILPNKDFPVLISWMGGRDVEKGIEIFNKAGIATYKTPEEAIKAFKYLHSYAQNLQELTEIPPRINHRLNLDRDRAWEHVNTGLDRHNGLLTEMESKSLLKAYGIPVNRTQTVATEKEAVSLAQEMGYPLVMKLVSRDITHKSDAGGVQLNIRDPEEVRRSFDRIVKAARDYDPEAKIEGVSLQPMVLNPEAELLLGAHMDRNFGPVLLFGLGGTLTEILKDRNLALPPLNRLLARRLIDGTLISRLLHGYRNKPAADLPLLEETIIRLSHLVIDFPQIVALDINPLVIAQGTPQAVDARVAVRTSESVSPQHLAISPYPAQYEDPQVVTDSGMEISIRPIQPEDAPLMEELFENLSLTSVYYRFFRPMKALPHHMLARFTQIDYDREMALVALSSENEKDSMLGVARVMADIGQKGEFAIVVGDPWQNKGVGEELLQRCLNIVKDMGMDEVWGMVLKENTGMIKLGKKLGFSIQWSQEEDAYAMTLSLRH